MTTSKLGAPILERRRYRELFAMLGAISTGLAVVAFGLALM